MDLSGAKAVLRAQALARRREVPAPTAASFAERLGQYGAELVAEAGAGIVSAYWPIRGEVSTVPLFDHLAQAGVVTALPIVNGRAAALTFRAWRPGEALVEAKMGIREPLSSAALVSPDLLFVPLSAFDRTGHRIGYGAGYYDRTLAQLRASKKIIAVGIAFAVQEIAEVPTENHDERLDYVLTEQELIFCRIRLVDATSVHR
jgi:5-formyltetrahydrofolate cyclo-ligase